MDMSIAAMSVDANFLRTQQDIFLALLKMQMIPIDAGGDEGLETAAISDPALGNNVDITA